MTRSAVPDDKGALRRRMKHRLGAMDAHEREAASAAAWANLEGQPMWRESRVLLIFMSMPREIDTGGAVQRALEGHGRKAVFIPRTAGENLDFRGILSLDDAEGGGLFGIREPPPGAPPWVFEASPEPILVIVPGLAFDEEGRRLGRGGGYYDRFIASVRRHSAASRRDAPLFAGLAFEHQVVKTIPAEAHDAPLDALITDARIRTFSRPLGSL